MAYFRSNSKYYTDYIFVCDICTQNYCNNYFNNPNEILQIIKRYEIKKGDNYYYDTKYKIDWCSKCYKNHNFSTIRRNNFIKKKN
jgi:hypothetical protein